MTKDFSNYIGEVNTAHCGFEMAIVKFISRSYIFVRFNDDFVNKDGSVGTVVCTSYNQFRTGHVRNPNVPSRPDHAASRVGEQRLNNSGELMTIISYRSSTDIDIRFDDDYENADGSVGTVLEHMSYDRFRRGSIRNPNRKSISPSLTLKERRKGEVSKDALGKPMTIVEYRSYIDVDILTADGIVVNTSYSAFKNGRVGNLKAFKRLGERRENKYGQMVTVIGYRCNNDIDVRFDDDFVNPDGSVGTVVQHKQYGDFIRGRIVNPYTCRKDNAEKIYLGKSYTTKRGEELKIVRVYGGSFFDVQFNDDFDNGEEFQNAVASGSISSDDVPYYISALNDGKVSQAGTIRKQVSLASLKNRSVRNPNKHYKSVRFKDRTGETGTSHSGESMTIENYRSSQSLDVRFHDDFMNDDGSIGTLVKDRTYQAFRKGLIRNPNRKGGMK